jgi:hypothetical protein
MEMSPPIKVMFVLLVGAAYSVAGLAIVGFAATLPFPSIIVQTFTWSVYVFSNLYCFLATILAAIIPAIIIVKIGSPKPVVTSFVSAAISALFIHFYTQAKLVSAYPELSSNFYSFSGILASCINLVIFISILPLLVGLVHKHGLLTRPRTPPAAQAGRA